MAELRVLPAALVSAAAAVRCFSVDVEPVTFGDWLAGAIADDFDARWGRALDALSADADATASALRLAADEYGQLERLLVPR